MSIERNLKKRASPVRLIILGVIGLIVLLGTLLAFSHYSISTTKEVRQCGFFASCQPGNAREKVEVTHFEPFSSASVAIVIFATIMLVCLAVGLSYYGNGRWLFRATSVLLVVLLVLLMTSITFVAVSGQELDGKTKMIGALSDEEYACQQRAIKSLDLVGPSIDCPSSSNSESFFKLDN